MAKEISAQEAVVDQNLAADRPGRTNESVSTSKAAPPVDDEDEWEDCQPGEEGCEAFWVDEAGFVEPVGNNFQHEQAAAAQSTEPDIVAKVIGQEKARSSALN